MEQCRYNIQKQGQLLSPKVLNRADLRARKGAYTQALEDIFKSDNTFHELFMSGKTGLTALTENFSKTLDDMFKVFEFQSRVEDFQLLYNILDQ